MYRIRRFVDGVTYYLLACSTVRRGKGDANKEVRWTTNIKYSLPFTEFTYAESIKDEYIKRGEVVDSMGYPVSINDDTIKKLSSFSPDDPVGTEYHFSKDGVEPVIKFRSLEKQKQMELDAKTEVAKFTTSSPFIVGHMLGGTKMDELVVFAAQSNVGKSFVLDKNRKDNEDRVIEMIMEDWDDDD